MKRLISIMLTGLLFAANLANADKGDISVGASAARASVDANGLGTNVDGDADGWRLFGRYMFSKNFGIESGYSTLGTPDDNSLPSGWGVESDSFDLYAVGAYPVTERLDLFGKIGAARWNTEIEESETSESSTNSVDLAVGIGGEFDLTKKFAIRGEFSWFVEDAPVESLISLSGVYSFKVDDK